MAKKSIYSKKEKEVFINKEFSLFLTFPIKEMNNLKIGRLRKKFPKLNIIIVFSKAATKNSFYHCNFSQQVLDAAYWQELMKKHNSDLQNLLQEINKIQNGK
jgi:hypothetical protein